jgi:hypothetical protein
MTTHCLMSTYISTNSKHYFACCRWINFSPIWHLKHLMEKLLLNEFFFIFNIQLNTFIFMLSPCSKKIFKEWNSQISPSNLKESFATNNLGPSKFHMSNNNPLQDVLDFLHIHGLVYLWCGKLHNTISCLSPFDAIYFGIWKWLQLFFWD